MESGHPRVTPPQRGSPSRPIVVFVASKQTTAQHITALMGGRSRRQEPPILPRIWAGVGLVGGAYPDADCDGLHGPVDYSDRV